MTLDAGLLLYLLMGGGVAVAVGVSEKGRFWRAAGALFFWPLFVPWLLGQPAVPPDETPAPAVDELSVAITRADEELQVALDGLDDWAGHVLLGEKDRIRELRSAWRNQAERIREMDRLLARPDPEPLNVADIPGDRVRHLEHARRANRDRLRDLRRQEHEDLVSSLAWVRELASMIHLARFRGEPVARAEELVRRLASAVEDFSTRHSLRRNRTPDQN